MTTATETQTEAERQAEARADRAKGGTPETPEDSRAETTREFARRLRAETEHEIATGRGDAGRAWIRAATQTIAAHGIARGDTATANENADGTTRLTLSLPCYGPYITFVIGDHSASTGGPGRITTPRNGNEPEDSTATADRERREAEKDRDELTNLWLQEEARHKAGQRTTHEASARHRQPQIRARQDRNRVLRAYNARTTAETAAEGARRTPEA